MKSLAFAFALLLAGMMPNGPIPPGTIVVKVVDQDNKPVNDAKVLMLAANHGVGGFVPSCDTDESGECWAGYLDLGKYQILAMKPTDGYPSPVGSFYHDWTPVIAEVTSAKPNVHVVYKLGPKAATIKVSVFDDPTGYPLKNFSIELIDPAPIQSNAGKIGADKEYPSIDANGNALIPPDQDIQVSVLAPGYIQWHMETQPGAMHEGCIHLHSGEKREFTVRLQPATKKEFTLDVQHQ